MKKMIILCLLAGLSIIAFGQIVTVIDAETGNPVELVTLSSTNPYSSTLTNSRGQTDISVFKEADKIEVRIVGYTPLIISYPEIIAQHNIINIERTSINFDEIVVSASNWQQKTSELSNKVITIQPRLVAMQNPQTAADLLNISGKVFIQKSQQGGGSPMIRGFATNRLLYTVDGVRMNTAIFRGGNIQNVISLDPFSIEHTEVLFGTGPVIYGSDAIGGVMSFKTITPQCSFTNEPLITGNAVSRYSSVNNEKTAHFDVNIGGEKWAGVTSFSYNNYGDLIMGSHGPDEYLRPFYVQRIDSADVIVTNEDERLQVPTGYTQLNMMQKLRFSPGKKLNFEYAVHFSETSEYSRYDRHVRYKNGLPRYGEWSYGPQKWLMNNLAINHISGNFYDQLSIRMAHQVFEESRISRDFNSPDRETRVEKVNAYSANADLIKSLGNLKLFYGLEAVLNSVESTGINEDIVLGTSNQGPARYPQSDWQSYAVYFSGQYNLTTKTTIHTGIRYNQYMLNAEFDTAFYPFPFTSAHTSDGALTGNLGIVMRPDNSLVLSANFSTGFRSPNVDDMGKVFDSEPGSVTVPNPDLHAEYAYNADLGIAKIFFNHIKVDITAYYTQLTNALVRRDYSLNGMDSIVYDREMSRVQAMQNAAVTSVYGVQAGVETKLLAGFSISSDINYQKGEEELDDGTTSPSRHAAPWFGNTRLKFTRKQLTMQLYAVYNGEKSFDQLPEEEKGKGYIYAMDDDGNPYSPAWYTINIKVFYELSGQFTISAGLENITDKRYRPYNSGIVAPGRNFIISARVSF